LVFLPKYHYRSSFYHYATDPVNLKVYGPAYVDE